jgi:peptide/nickel transport system substrate-binding protein
MLAWSGRPDPDGNLYSFHGCKQRPELRRLLQCRDRQAAGPVAGRSDPAERKKLFEQITAQVMPDGR